MNEKRRLFEQWLAVGMVRITLDPRHADVMVPVGYKRQESLVLNISRRFSIPEFDVSDERLLVALSFNKATFRCTIPWRTIFAMASKDTGCARVWQEDIPEDYKARMVSEVFNESKEREEKQRPTHLRLVN